ncbi:response regulator [Flagellimonas sp. 389]|uniref:response regulator n=1 Tax=Flagellimonas sp. 389 TaxID=2835862 RepID=UPI001BD1C87D|nr:response regulator [Flagellimonas sp. 389]MBS9461433.1 response regulator [Flagellimonas sp. 389]
MKEKLDSILLLDDNPATNYIHKKFIEKVNCTERVLEFQNGYEALKYIRDHSHRPPDLIFVDINMPIMDAWEFLEEFEKLEEGLRQKSKVFVLTTSLSPRDVEKANQIGFIEDIMMKPLSTDDIEQLMTKFF